MSSGTEQTQRTGNIASSGSSLAEVSSPQPPPSPVIPEHVTSPVSTQGDGSRETVTQFLSVDLGDGSLLAGKPFVGWASGTFIDMLGREVEFTEEDAREYEANTLLAIERNKERGMPGLPIDEEGHSRGKAAGWIVDVAPTVIRDSVGSVRQALEFFAEWTPLGVSLIKDRIMANFSPTVEVGKKVIRGGSLTNWPASMDANGIPLFDAIELSEGVHALARRTGVDPEDNTMAIELTREELEEMIDARLTERNPVTDVQELAATLEEQVGGALDNLDTEGIADLINQQVSIRFEQTLRSMRRSADVGEFAQRVTGGTDDNPHGLPVDAEELATQLLSLNEEQASFWRGLCESVLQHGLTDFQEAGHSRRNVRTLRALDDPIRRQLAHHVEQGGSVEQFFDAAHDILGDMAAYDLSEFQD